MKHTKITNKKILIKLGGNFINNQESINEFLYQLSKLTKDNQCVVVHGGGKELSKYTNFYGQKIKFDKMGNRITNKQSMLFADRILSGQINTSLVRLSIKNKIKAVGLSAADASLIVGEALHPKTHTGKVRTCNIDIINTLCSNNFVPIINPVSIDKNAKALNINADEIAQNIARVWQADYLLLLSDVKGILIDGNIKPILNVKDIKSHIKNGKITDGMIAKTQKLTQVYTKPNTKMTTIVIGTFSKNTKQKENMLYKLLQGIQGTHIIK